MIKSILSAWREAVILIDTHLLGADPADNYEDLAPVAMGRELTDRELEDVRIYGPGETPPSWLSDDTDLDYTEYPVNGSVDPHLVESFEALERELDKLSSNGSAAEDDPEALKLMEEVNVLFAAKSANDSLPHPAFEGEPGLGKSLTGSIKKYENPATWQEGQEVPVDAILATFANGEELPDRVLELIGTNLSDTVVLDTELLDIVQQNCAETNSGRPTQNINKPQI